jgi:hypothetical protein
VATLNERLDGKLSMACRVKTVEYRRPGRKFEIDEQFCLKMTKFHPKMKRWKKRNEDVLWVEFDAMEGERRQGVTGKGNAYTTTIRNTNCKNRIRFSSAVLKGFEVAPLKCCVHKWRWKSRDLVSRGLAPYCASTSLVA